MAESDLIPFPPSSVTERAIPHAAPMTPEQKRILKQTAGGGELSDDEFAMFIAVSARLGLDPLTKQIVATKFKNKRTGNKEMVLIVAITGMRTVCQRTGLDDGLEGPEFTSDGFNWTPVWLSSDPPAAARCTVWRKGASHPYSGVALFSEFAKKFPDGHLEPFWHLMPAHMLGKCAEALARRMSFADQLSGVYAPEEFGAIDSATVVDAVPPALPPAPPPAPPRAPVEPTNEREAIATLWNSLPADRRPTVEVMKDYGSRGGLSGQLHFLVTNHMGICGEGCPHLTERIRQLEAASEAVSEQTRQAADQGEHDGAGGGGSDEFAL